MRSIGLFLTVCAALSSILAASARAEGAWFGAQIQNTASDAPNKAGVTLTAIHGLGPLAGLGLENARVFRLGEHQIRTIDDFIKAARALTPGQEATLSYVRPNDFVAERVIAVTAMARPKSYSAPAICPEDKKKPPKTVSFFAIDPFLGDPRAPIEAETDFVKKTTGCRPSKAVNASFKKLHKIALEHQVRYSELVFSNINKDKSQKPPKRMEDLARDWAAVDPLLYRIRKFGRSTGPKPVVDHYKSVCFDPANYISDARRIENCLKALHIPLGLNRTDQADARWRLGAAKARLGKPLHGMFDLNGAVQNYAHLEKKSDAPSLSTLLVMLGRVQVRINDARGARHSFNKALETGARGALRLGALLGRAQASFLLKKYDASRADLKAFMKKFPNSIAGRELRAALTFVAEFKGEVAAFPSQALLLEDLDMVSDDILYIAHKSLLPRRQLEFMEAVVSDGARRWFDARTLYRRAILWKQSTGERKKVDERLVWPEWESYARARLSKLGGDL